MKNTVYVSLLYQQNQILKLLGIFTSRDKAVKRCLSEPTRTRQAWCVDSQNAWHNGAGLTAKVVLEELI